MTMISRVSTAQQYDTLLDAMRKTKGDIQSVTQEISTGLVSDVYQTSSGRTGISLELRNSKDVADTYITANTLIAGKMDTAASLLGAARDTAREVQSVLVQDQAWVNDPVTLQQTARAALDGIVTQFNTAYGGEYLFSGQATDTPPFAPDGAGGYIYQGGTTGDFRARIDVDAGMAVTIAPRADSAEIRATIDALSALANADYEAMSVADRAAFGAAQLGALGAGLDGLIALEAAHGSAQSTLEMKIASQRNLSAGYNNTIMEVEGVDPEEAATRLAASKAKLDSTYAVTAQLYQLSLLNHI